MTKILVIADTDTEFLQLAATLAISVGWSVIPCTHPLALKAEADRATGNFTLLIDVWFPELNDSDTTQFLEPIKDNVRILYSSPKIDETAKAASLLAAYRNFIVVGNISKLWPAEQLTGVFRNEFLGVRTSLH